MKKSHLWIVVMFALSIGAQSEASITALGDLPGGAFDSYVTDVSADGSVAVGRGRSASGFEAFRWTRSGGIVGLGDLPGGAFGSVAHDVSADGSVVVGQGSGASGREAFYWDDTSGMQPLYDLLVAQGDDLSHWQSLDLALAVSDDGLTVAGWGRNIDGNREAFVATLVPEPSSFGLFALGLLGLGAVNRRGQKKRPA